ncbi:7305_t:CDS:2 [Funneliformis geosporum]|nr:7305_t:CDS:2 [Funneliformis geosporum]
MVRERYHIILLIDNAKCHNCKNINNLSNIKVHFLPPNTISYFQLLDQESDPIPLPIDILDSINLIAKAWKKVTKKTIINKEYINIDDELIVEEELSLEEIVNIVKD